MGIIVGFTVLVGIMAWFHNRSEEKKEFSYIDQQKKEQEERKKLLALEAKVFNVESFNTWFNDPKNGATYAHSGIFLRVDKLSESHIQEYMEKVHKIKNFGPFMWTQPTRYMVSQFLKEIQKDWKKKLLNQ